MAPAWLEWTPPPHQTFAHKLQHPCCIKTTNLSQAAVYWSLDTLDSFRTVSAPLHFRKKLLRVTQPAADAGNYILHLYNETTPGASFCEFSGLTQDHGVPEALFGSGFAGLSNKALMNSDSPRTDWKTKHTHIKKEAISNCMRHTYDHLGVKINILNVSVTLE